MMMAVPLAWGLPTNQPLPPTGLVVEASDVGNQLSWNPPAVETGSEVTGYRVYRYEDEDKQSLAEVGAEVTQFLDAHVSANHTYVYYVTSVSATGESAPSNLASNYPPCTNIVYLDPPPPWVDLRCITPVGIVIRHLQP